MLKICELKFLQTLTLIIRFIFILIQKILFKTFFIFIFYWFNSIFKF